jgi:hypothetical protein
MQSIFKNILLVTGIVVALAAITVLPSRAMMGGGMRGNGQGGYSSGMMGSGGHMGGANGPGMTGQQGWHSGQGTYGGQGAYGQRGTVSTATQAESVVRGQIVRNPNLATGQVEDRGDAYMVDVVTRDGSLVDRVLVQKNNGSVRSVNQ